MGCDWHLTVWDDDVSHDDLTSAGIEAATMAEDYEQTFSRFRPDSYLNQLADQTGEFTVPKDFTAILDWYALLYGPSEGRLNPLVGRTMADLGYDADYSLQAKPDVNHAPELPAAVEVLAPGRISIKQPVHFDFGALGKGFFVDRVVEWLQEIGWNRFLVNGSGDMRYISDGTPLKVGLEDPTDPSQVIGRMHLTEGALASSASNRRRWAGYHHIIDATNSRSPEDHTATWVKADRCTLADALATGLFSTPPHRFHGFVFDYCLLGPNRKARSSTGFPAELF